MTFRPVYFKIPIYEIVEDSNGVTGSSTTTVNTVTVTTTITSHLPAKKTGQPTRDFSEKSEKFMLLITSTPDTVVEV